MKHELYFVIPQNTVGFYGSTIYISFHPIFSWYVKLKVWLDFYFVIPQNTVGFYGSTIYISIHPIFSWYVTLKVWLDFSCKHDAPKYVT